MRHRERAGEVRDDVLRALEADGYLLTADADAIHVYAGTITSSPGPTPIPCRPQISAAVPEVTANARCAPM